jgi:EAL and modified HD-GYP domain-containing signal transduction protein
MTASVLDRLTLCYQPLWGRARTLAGVALHIRQLPTTADATEPPPRAVQLLEALQDSLPHDAPAIFLVPQSAALLMDLLEQVERPVRAETKTFTTNGLFAPTIMVEQALLQNRPALAEAVLRAQQRGVATMWRGDTDQAPEPRLVPGFKRRWLTLSAGWAAAALRDALRSQRPGESLTAGRLPSGHIFDGVESRALMEYCLDRCGAFAVADWPAEDVVHSLRHAPLQPDHVIVLATLKALEADRPAEMVERTLCEDPILMHRFLVHANSPGVGLRSGVESVRHALMMLGTDTLRRWLAEQLPFASHEPSLRPVKAMMVMRAHLMDHLLDAGLEEALRREVSMCGLFYGMDMLFQEPLGQILARLPLSRRIYDALVLRTGPYADAFAVMLALEGSDTHKLQQICDRHDMPQGDINVALLHMIAGLSHTTIVQADPVAGWAPS